MTEMIRRMPRTFAVRSRQMGEARQRSYAKRYAQFGLDPTKRPDWSKTFPGRGAINIEIGFGSGDSILHFARKEPDTPLVGFEVYPVGVAKVLSGMADHGYANTRVVNGDALELLVDWFEPGQLGGVRLFFPDPWPKRRHHKRRIVNEQFVGLLAKLIRQNGVFHFKSDVRSYVEHVHKLLAAHEQFNVEQPQLCPEHAGDLVTRYERRARRAGASVWQLLARRGQLGLEPGGKN